MDFDERLIKREDVLRAIEIYSKEVPGHRPARSAFLIHEGKRLPAKFILKLAFLSATGTDPKAETFTGGRASVRVLSDLGFETVYERPNGNGKSRNPIKSARRAALMQLLTQYWGPVLTEKKFPQICVPDFSRLRETNSMLYFVMNNIESYRNQHVRGQINRKLAFDFYLPRVNLLIEFDERQHFTPLRAASLMAYPRDRQYGFDVDRWIALSNQIRAGDNSPIYRDEQRAFYDAVRDLMALECGFPPVIRIFEEDVAWEKNGSEKNPMARQIIESIGRLIMK